jgi:hypothetical protein
MENDRRLSCETTENNRPTSLSPKERRDLEEFFRTEPSKEVRTLVAAIIVAAVIKSNIQK